MPEGILYPKFTATFHTGSYPAIAPTRPELSAAGKTVFISGGGRGLGTSIVDAFATAGASHIIVLGRNAESLQNVLVRTEAAHPSTKVTVVSGDVSVEQDVARAFAEVNRVSPGGIDIVVANAGYLPAVKPVPAATNDGQSSEFTADWWRAWEVNVKGTLLLAQNFLACAKPNAVFISVSAGGCHINPAYMAKFSAYSGSKIGADRVVETLQFENPELRFYSVHPGVIESDMLTKSMLASGDAPLTKDDPELPGHFIVWLASPEAEFLKGKYLWVNWDVDELIARKEELMAPEMLIMGLLGWA